MLYHGLSDKLSALMTIYSGAKPGLPTRATTLALTSLDSSVPALVRNRECGEDYKDTSCSSIKPPNPLSQHGYGRLLAFDVGIEFVTLEV